MGESCRRRNTGPRRAIAALALLAASFMTALALAPGASAGVAPGAFGGIACNGYSPIQKPLRVNVACRDLNNPRESDDRFWDGSHYIGHDEPISTSPTSRAASIPTAAPAESRRLGRV